MSSRPTIICMCCDIIRVLGALELLSLLVFAIDDESLSFESFSLRGVAVEAIALSMELIASEAITSESTSVREPELELPADSWGCIWLAAESRRVSSGTGGQLRGFCALDELFASAPLPSTGAQMSWSMPVSSLRSVVTSCHLASSSTIASSA